MDCQGIVTSLRCSRRIRQIAVGHGMIGCWAGRGQAYVWGKPYNIVIKFLLLMGGGPLGFKERLGLCSTWLGETCGRGSFVGTDWVRHVGGARMIMTEWVRPNGDRLDQGIRLRLEYDDFMACDWHACEIDSLSSGLRILYLNLANGRRGIRTFWMKC